MTLQADTLPGSPLAAFEARDKSRAFRAALRHSRRVRVLRLATFGGAVALVAGIVLFTLFDPFRSVTLDGVSVDGASLSGTTVTMANPRLSGYHKDGRPYTITASAAEQDIKKPTLFLLRDLQARLTQPDRTTVTLTAAVGHYNSAEELMDLTSAVRMVGASGLDVRAQDAHIAFKTSAVTTDKPVTVAMKNSTVDADSLQIVDGGQHVIFAGHVHSLMRPDAPEGDAPPATAP